jgi:hypothetical protein
MSRNFAIIAVVAVLVAVTCWNQLPGQAPPAKPAMMKWEYKIIPMGSTDNSPNTLNEAGAEGWELSATYPYDDRNIHCVFRRPKVGK